MSDPIVQPVDLYTTLEELKIFMGIDLVSSENDAIMNGRLNALISVISRSIDVYCRRHFYPQEAERVYTLPKAKRGSPWRIWLDADLLTVDEVTLRGEVLDSSAYILGPRNQPLFNWIEFQRDVVYGIPWPLAIEEDSEVVVTGEWGFVTPQSIAMVRHACQLWIMELNQRTLYPGAQSMSIGDYSYSLRSDSEQRLNTPTGQYILAPPGQVSLLLNGFRRLDIRRIA